MFNILLDMTIFHKPMEATKKMEWPTHDLDGARTKGKI